ncbi:transmembrane protein, putative (macronuclear) [Tetrahymena thermophila SB210]|uniref:Transmembrane protein, putative n=1 Tax=Tetrahymena thermophila (strain SB210) TaxID=312017 RepID=W7X561_TETTS|nr:transmembrane protein, putative [Tetrahymena thermophila SB210]EWS72537.1 transmembrane protein, putative [Tetrahymena thermophila SB210]|eukprot:XP_012654917.1 transmembrane protein, putative [Tetrahymena thermophila SB210]
MILNKKFLKMIIRIYPWLIEIKILINKFKFFQNKVMKKYSKYLKFQNQIELFLKTQKYLEIVTIKQLFALISRKECFSGQISMQYMREQDMNIFVINSKHLLFACNTNKAEMKQTLNASIYHSEIKISNFHLYSGLTKQEQIVQNQMLIFFKGFKRMLISQVNSKYKLQKFKILIKINLKSIYGLSYISLISLLLMILNLQIQYQTQSSVIYLIQLMKQQCLKHVRERLNLMKNSIKIRWICQQKILNYVSFLFTVCMAEAQYIHFFPQKYKTFARSKKIIKFEFLIAYRQTQINFLEQKRFYKQDIKYYFNFLLQQSTQILQNSKIFLYIQENFFKIIMIIVQIKIIYFFTNF